MCVFAVQKRASVCERKYTMVYTSAMHSTVFYGVYFLKSVVCWLGHIFIESYSFFGEEISLIYDAQKISCENFMIHATVFWGLNVAEYVEQRKWCANETGIVGGSIFAPFCYFYHTLLIVSYGKHEVGLTLNFRMWYIGQLADISFVLWSFLLVFETQF